MRSEPKPLILVVEDEEELAKLISVHLEEAGMQAQICGRAAHAVRFLKRNFANLMLLDINLPDQSGFALLEELRRDDVSVPTIFLTGNALETTKVRGLELGDDYVTKPFGYAELIARIRAVLRRSESRDDHKVTKNARVIDEAFEICGATVHPGRLELSFPGDKIEKIGRKEFGILAYLHDNEGVVITRKALIHSVWGIHADVKSRSLDQYIVKVRDIFKRNGLTLDAFRTVHGVGYIFDPAGNATEPIED